MRCNAADRRAICEKTHDDVLGNIDRVEVTQHTKYIRTQPPATWPLCEGSQVSRVSRLQCATWCSSDVTCVGFEFYDDVIKTCQLVTLGSPCPVTSYITTSAAGSGYFHNDHVNLDEVMCG